MSLLTECLHSQEKTMKVILRMGFCLITKDFMRGAAIYKVVIIDHEPLIVEGLSRSIP